MDKPNPKEMKRLDDILNSIPTGKSVNDYQMFDVLVDLTLRKEYIAYLDFKGKFHVMTVDELNELGDNLKKVQTTKEFIGRYFDEGNYKPNGERYVKVKINPDCSCDQIPVTAIDRIVLLEKGKEYDFQQ